MGRSATSTAFVAALRDRLGLPDTADADAVYAAATSALELGKLRAEVKDLRAEKTRNDPGFQQRLADARMESVTSSDAYQQWGEPGLSTGAKELQDVTASPAYKNWRTS